MSFTIVTAEQRSPAWFAARVGRLTGSCAGKMLATIQKGEAAGRRDLRTRLVVERVTNEPQDDGFINAVMQRGIDKEPDAFKAYEAATGNLTRRTGFLSHDTLLMGCSLDGDVGDFAGIIELKCPKSATHLEYLKAGGLPAEHKPQILHNLLVSGAGWCDFVSFDDRFPPHLQLVIVRVLRNEVEIVAYEKCALAFLAEVEAEYQAVLKLAEAAA